MYKNLKKNERRRSSRKTTNQNSKQRNALVDERDIQQSNKKNKSSDKRIDRSSTDDHRDIHFAQQIERVFEIEIYRKMQTDIENDQENDQDDQKKISTQKQNREVVKNIQESQKSSESRCR